MAGKLGRLAPHPEETHPRLKLAQFLDAATLPPIPAEIDYVSAVREWPMYANDRIGDCTCAAAGHMIEAWTTYGSGTTQEPTEDEIVAAYSAITGYDPDDPSTDQGAVMQDVLDYWRKTGIGGHKILAFAQVDLTNEAEVDAALYLFGHVYVGLNFPASAMDQFDANQRWDVVPGSPIEGGHAVNLGYQGGGSADRKVVTWGRLQALTDHFWNEYVEEAWVVVSQEWINEQGQSPAGLDTGALNAAFSEITRGEPGPFPAGPQPVPDPTPTPEPTPQPAPPAPSPADDADQALAEVARWFVRGHRHPFEDREMVHALRAWLRAKGLSHG